MAKSKKSATSKPFGDEITIQELPLKNPVRSGPPGGKTLLDLIEEKRPRNPDGTPVEAHQADEEMVVFGPGMQAFTWMVPLMMLLFSLDYLVHAQYRQEVEMSMILMRVFKAAPAIFILHYIFHPRRHWVSAQIFFFTVSIAAGCWLVQAVNKSGYYAVMKRAPPVGTLWIWAAVEMSLGPIVLSSLIVASYTRYHGYSFL